MEKSPQAVAPDSELKLPELMDHIAEVYVRESGEQMLGKDWWLLLEDVRLRPSSTHVPSWCSGGWLGPPPVSDAASSCANVASLERTRSCSTCISIAARVCDCMAR